jgi:hypothetical protein
MLFFVGVFVGVFIGAGIMCMVFAWRDKVAGVRGKVKGIDQWQRERKRLRGSANLEA